MPWAKSFCPLPFRYAPVTVGSGRVGQNLRILRFEPTLKSQFYGNLLLIINKLQRQKNVIFDFFKWAQILIKCED